MPKQCQNNANNNNNAPDNDINVQVGLREERDRERENAPDNDFNVYIIMITVSLFRLLRQKGKPSFGRNEISTFTDASI